jgi:hypothetical protein
MLADSDGDMVADWVKVSETLSVADSESESDAVGLTDTVRERVSESDGDSVKLVVCEPVGVGGGVIVGVNVRVFESVTVNVDDFVPKLRDTESVKLLEEERDSDTVIV